MKKAIEMTKEIGWAILVIISLLAMWVLGESRSFDQYDESAE